MRGVSVCGIALIGGFDRNDLVNDHKVFVAAFMAKAARYLRTPSDKCDAMNAVRNVGVW